MLLLGLVSAPAIPAAIPAASHARGTAETTAGSTAGTTAGTTLGRWTYAFALYGQARYPEGFLHYDFVNPDAPKGGTLTLSNPDLRSSFDKFNPFTLSGEAPRGVELLTFETLADPSPDEPATMYGLLARAMLIAPDFSSITFQIDSRAHFTNGDPVTAEDVKYSFDAQTGPAAAPGWASQFDGVRGAVILDPRTVRFDLKKPSRDQIFLLGTALAVFSRKWGQDADHGPKPFEQIVTEPPIATGPYTVGEARAGRYLELRRDPKYWAQDLGVRRGFFNFDRIIYHYFADGATRFEAFKAGDFDLIKEYDPKRWATQYEGERFAMGRIRKASLADQSGVYFEGFLLNQRRTVFQDARVREALNDSFDGQWLARQRFGLASRVLGLFENSPFAATGRPSSAELQLLLPYRGQLPAAVFGPLPENPRTDTGAYARRANLLHARDLLNQAGWTLGPDGRLRNRQGQTLDFEFLGDDLGSEKVITAWQRNLERLGIHVTYRVVDPAVYLSRIQNFDFDAIRMSLGNFLVPSAALMDSFLSSQNALLPASNNYMGAHNAAIDQALAAMSQAQTMGELVTATRALDRVFVCEHFAIPLLYRPFSDVAYWDRFGIPERAPRFFSIDEGYGTLPWPLETWWDKSVQ